MLKRFALDVIPATRNLQSTQDLFLARLRGVDGLLQGFERCLLAIPVKKQAVRASFDSSFSQRSIGCRKGDDHRRRSWLARLPVLTNETDTAATLRAPGLREHFNQLTHCVLFLLIISRTSATLERRTSARNHARRGGSPKKYPLMCIIARLKKARSSYF